MATKRNSPTSSRFSRAAVSTPARKPRARPAPPAEIEPDVLAQGPVPSTAEGIIVRRRQRGALFSYELVIDDFSALQEAASAAKIPADGHLAAALVDRLRFELGGKAWNGRFSFEGSSRAQFVLRGSDEETLRRIAERYRSTCRSRGELKAAMGRLHPDILAGVFDAL